MADPTAFGAVFATVALAAMVQGLSGFGFGLTMMSIAPWFVDITFAVPLTAVFSLVVVFAMTWRHRRHIKMSNALPLILGAIPGIPVGMAFLKGVDPGIATGTLGAVLVLYGGWSLTAGQRQQVEIHPRWAPGFGFFAGILGGAFNCSGPPTVLYSTLRAWDKGTIVGTLQAFFLVQGLLTTAGFIYTGLITVESLTWNGQMIPAVLIGLWVGNLLHDRVDQAMFRRVVLVALTLMGVAFLVPLAVG